MAASPDGQFKDDFTRMRCEKVAGLYFTKLMHGYDITIDHLNHADPRARSGALMLMKHYWKRRQDYAQICERIAREDTDPKVRALALGWLSLCYTATSDSRIGKWLAEIVRDEMQPLLFRRQAYFSLFSVRGLAKILDTRTFQFPDQVDWSLVASFDKER